MDAIWNALNSTMQFLFPKVTADPRVILEALLRALFLGYIWIALVSRLLLWVFKQTHLKEDMDREIRVRVAQICSLLLGMVFVVVCGITARLQGMIPNLAHMGGHIIYFTMMALGYLALYGLYRNQLKRYKQLEA